MKLRRGRVSYPLPLDICQIHSVDIHDNKVLYLYCLPQVSERIDINKVTVGHPKFFIVKDGKIFFQPVPDKAYTAKIRYTVVKEI